MKEKSIQRRVMEAGFGAMLERHGFEKLSATAYRRVYGRIIWTTVLAPGFEDADHGKAYSLLDATGYMIEGLEDLLKAYQALTGETGYTYPIAGTRYRAFARGSVIAYKSTYNRERVPQPLRPATFLERLLGLKPPRNEFNQFAADFPKSRGVVINANKTERDPYWSLSPTDSIDDFTKELCWLWETYEWAYIQKSERDHDEGRFIEIVLAEWQQYHPPELLAAYAAGQHDQVAEALRIMRRYGDMTKDQVVELLVHEGRLKRSYLSLRGMTRDQTINGRYKSLGYARQSWHALKTLLPDLPD